MKKPINLEEKIEFVCRSRTLIGHVVRVTINSKTKSEVLLVKCINENPSTFNVNRRQVTKVWRKRKKRSIWVNEFEYGLSNVCYTSKDNAIRDKSIMGALKTVTFIEIKK